MRFTFVESLADSACASPTGAAEVIPAATAVMADSFANDLRVKVLLPISPPFCSSNEPESSVLALYPIERKRRLLLHFCSVYFEMGCYVELRELCRFVLD